MKKRAIGFFAALLFALSGIVMRVFQIVNSDIANVSQGQSTVTITVATARGTIYDRNGNPLTNKTAEYRASVIATPTALSAFSELVSQDEFYELSEKLKSGKPILQLLKGPLVPTDGILQFVTPVRHEADQTAAHVIGYLGDDGQKGVAGIEKAFDEELANASGSVTVTYRTDGNGKVLTGGETTINNTMWRTKAGVALTLDDTLQRLVEQEAAPLIEKGAVVVMDPYTSDILVSASFPDFEPSELANYLDGESAPLFNRATAAYNCGSVFKIVTAAAALENGLSVFDLYRCDGHIRVGANDIRCHNTLGHGTQTMMEALQNSCNPYFIQLTQAVGGTTLYRTATTMGFGSPLVLGKGITTASSAFPTISDLLQPTALANVSFGQGFLTATPIHIAHITSAVVNGGKAYRPNLVMGLVNETGEMSLENREPPMQFFSKETANSLKDMLIAAVEEGTGNAALPKVGGAGGKTGTAQTGWKSEDGSTMLHSWFTGFYPAQNPQYVITVVCEDVGNTKKNSALVFQTLCNTLYQKGLVTC